MSYAMRKILPSTAWLAALGCLIMVAFIYFSGKVSFMSKLPRNPTFTDVLSKISVSAKSCVSLVDDWSKYNMSEDYFRLLPDFEHRLKEATKTSSDAEGHVGNLPEMMRFMHLVASLGNVKTVCETGFNYGHSSFTYLTANKNLFVHSFDLGSHSYTRKMAENLKDMFKSRIEVHFGDSTKTVPEFKATGGLPRCDLIMVDGGHVYPVAKADLINFGTHASPDNLVILDDYPTGWGAPFGMAWEELRIKGDDLLKMRYLDVNDKHIKVENVGILELVKCSFAVKPGQWERGFTLGKYVFKV